MAGCPRQHSGESSNKDSALQPSPFLCQKNALNSQAMHSPVPGAVAEPLFPLPTPRRRSRASCLSTSLSYVLTLQQRLGPTRTDCRAFPGARSLSGFFPSCPCLCCGRPLSFSRVSAGHTTAQHIHPSLQVLRTLTSQESYQGSGDRLWHI